MMTQPIYAAKTKDENAIVVEAWNSVLFEKFSRFRHILTRGLSGHGPFSTPSLPMSASTSTLS